jgi:hypothetical protein
MNDRHEFEDPDLGTGRATRVWLRGRVSQDLCDDLTRLAIQQTIDSSGANNRKLLATQPEQMHQCRMIVEVIDNV